MSNPARAGTGSALISWFDRRPARSNRHCLYCGELVGEGAVVPSNKEHLIGRSLVPPSSFADARAFNFHFRACLRCNAEKSRLEDHVAAVTLMKSPGRAERPDVDAVARKKALGSYDPSVRGTVVGEVRHGRQLKVSSMLAFGFVAAAQLDPEISADLAYRQMQGLFSLVNSSDHLSSDGTTLLPGDLFHVFGSYPVRDWGNAQLVKIADRAQSLTSYVETTTAEGFFRASLRESAEGWWFWALEWNKSHRLLGWIGSEPAPSLFSDLPALNWRYHGDPSGDRTRVRKEQPHDPSADVLFDFAPTWPDGGRNEVEQVDSSRPR